MIDIKTIAETLVNLSIKDINKLSKILQEEYGIEPNIPSNTKENRLEQLDNTAKTEKHFFNVIVKSHGNSKLALIKKIKEISGLGLKESKELVDNLPKIIKENVSKDEANSLKQKLEEVGAEVELK